MIYVCNTKLKLVAALTTDLSEKEYFQEILRTNKLGVWLFVTNFFDALLTVHLSIILVNNQLNAQILVL